ncbi:MAG: hypothetical protein HY868_03705 [Chloroflexi bacterium]|nr:hypothetical protein [Chloroflexota bacterium]
MPAKAKKPMPKFTKSPDELVKRFENALKDFPMAATRKMFGYPAAFVNGNMFIGETEYTEMLMKGSKNGIDDPFAW